MMKSLHVVSLACALAIAGCSTDVMTYDAHGERGGYHAGDLDYAGRKGAIETVIAGNPFGVDKARFDAHVLSRMQGQTRALDTEFVPAAGPRTDPLYRTVVVFDMAEFVDPDRMCRDGLSVPTHPQRGTVRMAIAFCEGDRAKSDAYGIAKRVNGIDDPKFDRLVRETTYVMIPDELLIEHDRNGDGHPRIP